MSRHSRQQAGFSPGAVYSDLYVFGNATAAQALANYEPKPSIPLAIRPVTTPANNHDLFKAQQSAIRDAHIARLSGVQPGQNKPDMMLPGSKSTILSK